MEVPSVQIWMNTLKSGLENYAQGMELEMSENRERCREEVID